MTANELRDMAVKTAKENLDWMLDTCAVWESEKMEDTAYGFVCGFLSAVDRFEDIPDKVNAVALSTAIMDVREWVQEKFSDLKGG